MLLMDAPPARGRAKKEEPMSTKDRIAEVASRPYWSEADARVIVEAWQASDETLGRFAQRHGVHRGRLSRWALRLGSAEPAPVRFHPVQLAGDGVASGRGAAPIEIEVGAGRDVRVIRVAPGFAADDLRRVLAVLDGRPLC
jgi:hypothetical protein